MSAPSYISIQDYVRVPQTDGSVLLKPGRVRLVEEMGTKEFARRANISQRHVQTLCDEGKIRHRRIGPWRNAKIMIPANELPRLLAHEVGGPR